MPKPTLYPILETLLAALLFGASAPLSKLLLGEVEPIPLAALLYFGSGAGMALLQAVRAAGRKGAPAEASLARPDAPWLLGAVLAGGVAAPIVLLFALRATPAATASLLLNFESVATALIAALVFREATGRRMWWAMALITAASIFLSLNLSGAWGLSLGALGVLAACFLWGLDNNLTRSISAKDPLAIVTIKGLGAGAISLLLGLSLGNSFPSPDVAVLAMLLGSLSYGLSIALFVHAMRCLGAARTGALFATAPFAGALLSFLLLREVLPPQFYIAFPLMAAGAVLLLSENHGHPHQHEALEHDHQHTHPDAHHDHAHASAHAPALPQGTLVHAHVHTHPPCAHAHEHTPDLHHRHEH